MFQAGKIFFMASAMSLAALPVQAASAETQAAALADEANPAPRLYNDAMRLQVEKGIAQIEQMFGLTDLPPIDESRLPAARLVAGTLSQRASVEEMLDNLYGRLFKGFSDQSTRIKPSELSVSFGLSEAAAEKVTAEQLRAVVAILDPQRAERDDRIKAIVRPIMNLALDKMVPRLQEGQARSLARRLTAEQLSDVHRYLQTPTGAVFAQHLLPLNADPEIMAATIRAIPDMLPHIEKEIEPLSRAFENLPMPKNVSDLNDPELRQVAAILKTDFKNLKAQVEKEKAEIAARKAFAAEAAATSYEAYDRDNWSADQRQRVEALEAAASAAQEAVSDAEMQAIKDASARLSSGQSAQ